MACWCDEGKTALDLKMAQILNLIDLNPLVAVSTARSTFALFLLVTLCPLLCQLEVSGVGGDGVIVTHS